MRSSKGVRGSMASCKTRRLKSSQERSRLKNGGGVGGNLRRGAEQDGGAAGAIDGRRGSLAGGAPAPVCGEGERLSAESRGMGGAGIAWGSEDIQVPVS